MTSRSLQSQLTSVVSTTGIGLVLIPVGALLYSAGLSNTVIRTAGVVVASAGFTLEMLKLSGRISEHHSSNPLIKAVRAYASLYVVFLAILFPIAFMSVFS